jgi:branched-chain amino acid transport system substrate-binding protein
MKRVTSLALMAATALVALGCAPGGGSADVKIGLIVSLQGAGAPYGNAIQRGVELAVEEINAAGGVEVHEVGQKPLTLITRDAQSQPAAGVQAAGELIEAGVIATVGAEVSDVTLAIAEVFQAAEVILMSPASSTPKLSNSGDFIYRNFPSDELEALNTADYVFNQMHLREAAVIAQQSEFGLGQKNSFIQRFRLLGGRALGQESYPIGAPDDDIAEHVSRILGDEPPAIYIAGYTEDTAAVARAVRAAGSEAALFGTGAVLATDLIAAGGEAVDGLAYPQASFDVDSDAGVVREFVAAYGARYGGVPDVYAAHAYDAVKMIALAISQAGVDPHELRFYLNSMNPYDGVTGSTDFDDNGDVRKFHTMFGIEGGAAIRLEN